MKTPRATLKGSSAMMLFTDLGNIFHSRVARRSEDHRSHYASAVSSEHSRSLCIIEYKAKHHDIYEIWPGLGKHHLADKFLHIVVTSDDVT